MLKAGLVALVMVAACGGGGGAAHPDAPAGDAGPDAPPAPVDVTDPIPFVDPTIGTGGLGFAHGACFVGAAAPHGMVKVGPDTSGPYGTASFLHFSGYWAGDNKIRGFSHLHLHGAGATDYGVLSVMPTLAFDPTKWSVVDYEQKFAKIDELAEAGVYRVKLANRIGVELTATPRAAVHRYSLPAPGTLVVDLAKQLGDGEMSAQEVALDGGELVGSFHAKGGMSGSYGGYTLYFAIRASFDLAATQLAATGAAIPLPRGPSTLVVGLSYNSIAAARANRDAEVPATASFDDVVAATQAAWRAKLGAALLSAPPRDARIFYTSLYHAFLMPSVIDDADGTYRLAGMAAPATATGYHQMSDQSLWDTYRTVFPLYAWLAPDSARDATRSLVGFADGTGAYPRWPIAIGESGTMLGASAEIALADAVARGVAGAPEPAAIWPLLAGEALAATPPPGGRGERDAVDDYMAHAGYVASDAHGRSVSTTTEYAHDDFSLAVIADAAGDAAAAAQLRARSHGWQQLYDPAVGFLRAKSAAGAFGPVADFDPLMQLPDYAEANAWQSLWMVGIHDPDGLATVLGGRAAAIAKLTTFFTMAKAERDAGDDTGALPPSYYWHGNEPDLNAPFLFAQWGDAADAQTWTRWVLDTYYSDQVDGVAGNDDGGTLGAWYVLASLGLFPIAGSDGWLVGAPRFSRATIGALTITTEGSGTHVASATLDGAPLDPTVPLAHARLAAAHALHVSLVP